MSDKNFRVTFTRGTSSSVITTSVRASSASQAKEKIKERERVNAGRRRLSLLSRPDAHTVPV